MCDQRFGNAIIGIVLVVGSALPSGCGNTVCAPGAVRAPDGVNCYFPRVRLIVTRDGGGSGLVTSDTVQGRTIDCGSVCTEEYISTQGSVVNLTATPDAGSIFVGWSGDCSGTGTCTVTMDADRTVTATFTLAVQVLTVVRAGDGSGTVVSTPAGIDCGLTCATSFAVDTMVTLTATPAGGSVFAGWSGDCSGVADCTVTMDAARNVTASFSAPTHSLTVSFAGSGTGSVVSSPVGISCPGTCAATHMAPR